MKKYLQIILFISISLNIFSQDIEYFDSKFETVKKESQATYYRQFFTSDSAIIYYKNGTVFFQGKYFDVDNDKLQGCCVWFNPDGTTISKQCYKDGEYVSALVTDKPFFSAWIDYCSDCELSYDDKDRIEWSGVIDYPDKAEALFQRSFFAIKDFDHGLDIDSNSIKKRVSRDFEFDLFYSMTSINEQDNQFKVGKVKYTLSVYSKDDRYKYRFHDFKLYPYYQTSPVDLETVYNNPSDYFKIVNDMGTSTMLNKDAKQMIATQLVMEILGYIKKQNGEKKVTLGMAEWIVRKMETPINTLVNKKAGATEDTDDDW